MNKSVVIDADSIQNSISAINIVGFERRIVTTYFSICMMKPIVRFTFCVLDSRKQHFRRERRVRESVNILIFCVPVLVYICENINVLI